MKVYLNGNELKEFSGDCAEDIAYSAIAEYIKDSSIQALGDIIGDGELIVIDENNDVKYKYKVKNTSLGVDVGIISVDRASNEYWAFSRDGLWDGINKISIDRPDLLHLPSKEFDGFSDSGEYFSNIYYSKAEAVTAFKEEAADWISCLKKDIDDLQEILENIDQE